MANLISNMESFLKKRREEREAFSNMSPMERETYLLNKPSPVAPTESFAPAHEAMNSFLEQRRNERATTPSATEDIEAKRREAYKAIDEMYPRPTPPKMPAQTQYTPPKTEAPSSSLFDSDLFALMSGTNVKPIGPLESGFHGGTGQVVKGVGDTARWLGAKNTGEKIAKTGQEMQTEAAEQWDPNDWVYKIPSYIPYVAALAPLGMGGYALGAAGAGALGAGTGLSALAGSATGAVASRAVESAMEAGGVYDEALQRGMSEEEAQKAAKETFKNNTWLVFLDAGELATALAPLPAPLKKILGVASEAGADNLIRGALAKATGIGLTAVQEAGEEVAQDVIQRKALGDPVAWDEQMKEAALGGGVMGGLFGGLGAVATGLDSKAETKTEPTIPAVPPSVKPLDAPMPTSSNVAQQAQTMPTTETIESVQEPPQVKPLGAEMPSIGVQPESLEAQHTVKPLDAPMPSRRFAPLELSEPLIKAESTQTEAPAVGTPVAEAPKVETTQVKVPKVEPTIKQKSGYAVGDLVHLKGRPNVYRVVNTSDPSLVSLQEEGRANAAVFQAGRAAVEPVAQSVEVAEPVKPAGTEAPVTQSAQTATFAMENAPLPAFSLKEHNAPMTKATLTQAAQQEANAHGVSLDEFLASPDGYKGLISNPKGAMARLWLTNRMEQMGKPVPPKVSDLMVEMNALTDGKLSNRTQELPRVQAELEEAITQALQDTKTPVERLLAGEEAIPLTGRELPTEPTGGKVETETPPVQASLEEPSLEEQQAQLANLKSQLETLRTEKVEIQTKWNTNVEKIAKDLAKEATKRNREIRKGFWRRIKEHGRIAPYKNKHMGEDFYSRVPLHLRSKKGVPLDELATDMGYASEEALLNDIEAYSKLKDVAPEQAWVEAEHYLAGTEEGATLRTLLDEYYTPSIDATVEAIQELEGRIGEAAQETGTAEGTEQGRIGEPASGTRTEAVEQGAGGGTARSAAVEEEAVVTKPEKPIGPTVVKPMPQNAKQEAAEPIVTPVPARKTVNPNPMARIDEYNASQEGTHVEEKQAESKQKKPKTRLGKQYSVPDGSVFRVAYIANSDGSKTRIDVKVREGRDGALVTKAAEIKRMALEEYQHRQSQTKAETAEIDDFTRKHLDNWLEHNVYEDERDSLRERMLAIVSEDPSWLDVGWGRVREIADSMEPTEQATSKATESSETEPETTAPKTEPATKTLSDFADERLQWAIGYRDPNPILDRQFKDEFKRIGDKAFKERLAQDGYVYSYFSPNRPVEKVGNLGVAEGRFLFTTEPLTLEQVVDMEVVPFGDKTRTELVVTYTEARYGNSDVIVFYKDDGGGNFSGYVVAPSAKKKGYWQATRFDNDGFSSDTARSTKEDALAFVMDEGYRQIVDPSILESLVLDERFQAGIDKSMKTETQRSVEEPAPQSEQKALPFGEVPASEDSRYSGSEVTVAADPARGEPEVQTTVYRVLNNGTLIEVYRPDADGKLLTYRVNADRVTVDELVDNKTEATAETPVVRPTPGSPKAESAQERMRQKVEQAKGKGAAEEEGSVDLGAFGRKAEQVELAEGDVSFDDPDIEERYQAAKGIPKRSWKEVWAEKWENFKRSLSDFEYLGRGKEHAKLTNELRRLKKMKGIASDLAIMNLQGVTVNLNEGQYDLMTRKLILDDLIEELGIQKKAIGEKQKAGQVVGLEPKLPFGFTEDTLKAAHEKISAAVANDQQIQQAIDDHKAVQDEVVKNYCDAMEAVTGHRPAFERKDYFRHQVIAMVQLAQEQGKSGAHGTGEVKAKMGRSFLKRRGGSELDINTEYLQVQHDLLTTMLHDTQVYKVLKLVENNYDIKAQCEQDARVANQKAIMSYFAKIAERWNKQHPGQKPITAKDVYQQVLGDKEASERTAFLKEKLGDQYKTWEKMVPEGYTTSQAWEGSMFYKAFSIPEQFALRAQEEMLTEIGVPTDTIREVFARGAKRKEIVIPTEVAATLKNFQRNAQSSNPITKFLDDTVRTSVGYWKTMQLFFPKRFAKYMARNVSGDVDAVIAGNPATLKKVKQATEDLYVFFYHHGAPSVELKEWIERGGMQDLFSVAEKVTNINGLAVFRNVTKGETDPNILSKYLKTVRGASDFRESILRYASYLSYKEQMQNSGGKPKNFGASIREEVMELEDIRDRAYKLSNDLVGAYDEVSIFGQWLRDRWFPFWSWKEVNFKRNKRLIENAWRDAKSASEVGAAAAKTLTGVATRSAVIGYNLGKFVLKATAFTAMCAAWNTIFFPDEEEELPQNVRSRPHLIFGRNKDGKIIYFSRLGALGDFLEWFGLAESPVYVEKFLNGEMSLKEIAQDMVKAPVNEVVQGLGPAKAIAELATGKTLYPDMFRSRTIRDRWEYLAQVLTADDVYREVAGKPTRGAGDVISNMFVYKLDPDEVAYNEALSLKYDYLKKTQGVRDVGAYSPKSNALYYFKQALRLDDKRAMRKYMLEYQKYGGTKKGMHQSLKRMHPLGGLAKKDLQPYVDSLNERDKKTLERAIDFYHNVLEASGYENMPEYKALPLK